MAAPEKQLPAPATRRPSLRLVTGGPDARVGKGVRVFGAVAVVAALAGGVGFLAFGGSQPESLAASSIVPKRAAPPLLGTPAAVPAVKPVQPVRPESIWPAPLESALKRHRVVVASLYAEGAAVADMARSEARAGATLAGAGFGALNVLNQKQVEQLTARLGVMNDPTVLVFTRPGEVFVRLDGFVDRETVAQAAANAKSGL